MIAHATKIIAPILMMFAASAIAASSGAPASGSSDQPIIMTPGYVADPNDVKVGNGDIPQEDQDRKLDIYHDPEQYDFDSMGEAEMRGAEEMGGKAGGGHAGGGGGRR
jgi:hypothetical protein